MCVAQPHTSWLASLSPWPAEFGLGRRQALLAELGDPQKAYPAVHVVGTNGKSTATRTIEELLLADGLSVRATISPHLRGWGGGPRVFGRRASGSARPSSRRSPRRPWPSSRRPASPSRSSRRVSAGGS